MKFENIIQILKSTQTISFLQFHVIAILEKKTRTYTRTYISIRAHAHIRKYIYHTYATYICSICVRVRVHCVHLSGVSTYKIHTTFIYLCINTKPCVLIRNQKIYVLKNCCALAFIIIVNEPAVPAILRPFLSSSWI